VTRFDRRRAYHHVYEAVNDSAAFVVVKCGIKTSFKYSRSEKNPRVGTKSESKTLTLCVVDCLFHETRGFTRDRRRLMNPAVGCQLAGKGCSDDEVASARSSFASPTGFLLIKHLTADSDATELVDSVLVY
jgi:hypothetical protein